MDQAFKDQVFALLEQLYADNEGPVDLDVFKSIAGQLGKYQKEFVSFVEQADLDKDGKLSIEELRNAINAA
ncbi:hypothetical protein ACFXDE_21055 [Kitasatospora sp. NPDC059408]|uniref:hypothetical protein n=1 Tax=Kitasatospora sp. NPDC059408 TaxID=3346823 RepID=UPI0036B5459F